MREIEKDPIGLQLNRRFDTTHRAVANTNHILGLPDSKRNWRTALEERRLRLTPLWKEVVYSEAEMMSGPFKVPKLDEMRSRRKTRKAKEKEPEAANLDIGKPAEAAQVNVSEPMIQSTEKVSASKKRKAVVEVEEDAEGVVVRIPHGSTAISDPSSLSKFIKRLLLEEDEQRLTELGPTETSKKIAALSYQVMECGIFMQQYAELSQRRMRDLEKANTSVRRDFGELKANFDATERKLKKVEKELKETQATLKLEKEVSEATNEALKDSVESLRNEKAELLDQLELVAFESMMKERSSLMEEYLAGQNVAWKPKKWIREYERLAAGVSLTSEGEEEEDGEEVFSKETVEEKQMETGEAEEVMEVTEKQIETDVAPSSTEIIPHVPSQTTDVPPAEVQPSPEVPSIDTPVE